MGLITVLRDRLRSADFLLRVQKLWPRLPLAPIVWPGLGPRVDPTQDWPAWAVIGLVVLAYAGRVLDLPLEPSAGPATYALHPLFAVLAIGLDGLTALRIALLASFLAAGFGMWWFSMVFGLGRGARTWAALGYALAGIAAASLLAGDVGLVLGYAWLPPAVAYTWLAITLRRPGYLAAAAASLGLVVLSGHLGLILASLACLVLFVLVVACERKQGRFTVRSEVLWPGGALGVLGLGVGAVAWLPGLAAGSGAPVLGPYLPAGSLAVWRAYLDAGLATGGGQALSQGAYAYVGSVPFLFLVGLFLAPRPGRDRIALAMGLVAVIAFIGLSLGLGSGVFLPGGLLAWGTLAIWGLAGQGLEGLWRRARSHWHLKRVYVPDVVRYSAARGGAALILLLAAFSLFACYRANQPLLASISPGSPFAPAALPEQGLRLLQIYAGAYSFLFKSGVAVSALSFVGILSLLVSDVRRRRRRIETEAVYTDGVLQPAAPLGLPDGTPVHVVVEPAGAEAGLVEEAPAAAGEAGPVPAGEAAPAASVQPAPQPLRRVSADQMMIPAEILLFALALLIYLGTRLWAIDRFPIYFFADEATHAVYAQELLERGLKDAKGSFLPIYFEAAGNRWTPLLSVYVHAIVVALFGKSILVTRVTGTLVSLLAALAVALILKWVFRARFWWAGALLMAVAPAWFLHSRTGFETVMMSSFFACFLLCYLLYRTRSPRFLFPAILFGAATFYTYSNGQLIMAAAGALLALFDLPYHLKNWRTTLLGLVLIAVLAVPVFQFRASQPESMKIHVRTIDSYWFHNKPLSEKLAQFVETYTYGLSPAYWFVPNEHDLVRHRMKGYGNLNLPLLPFFLVGAGLCLWRVRSAPQRAVLLAALATPAGAALVNVSITRVLAFTVPASILIGLGLEAGWGVIKKRVPYSLAATLLFAMLAGGSIWMTRDALANGPLWYSDYGLYGMQYGARQLFQEVVPELLRTDPDVRIMMTSTWANGADTFIRFFLPKAQHARVQMLNIDFFMQARRPSLDANTLLVMTPAEYEQARSSPKFKRVDVERVVPYPDGRPGFYFARLEYADNIEEILAQEREARSRPVVEQFELDGQLVQVSHSIFDAGQLKDLFDGDPFTLARGLEANPLVLDFTFAGPRVLNGLSATFGSMDFTLTARLYGEEGAEPQVYTQTFQGLPPDPTVALRFDQGPGSVVRLRLEVLQLNAGPEVHIHVREIAFQ